MRIHYLGLDVHKVRTQYCLVHGGGYRLRGWPRVGARDVHGELPRAVGLRLPDYPELGGRRPSAAPPAGSGIPPGWTRERCPPEPGPARP